MEISKLKNGHTPGIDIGSLYVYIMYKHRNSIFGLTNREEVRLMQMTLKKWGNGTGLLFSKEFLRRAGVAVYDTLEAEIVDGKIVLTPGFRHRSLRERAAEYGGNLNLSSEMDWGEPSGREVW